MRMGSELTAIGVLFAALLSAACSDSGTGGGGAGAGGAGGGGGGGTVDDGAIASLADGDMANPHVKRLMAIIFLGAGAAALGYYGYKARKAVTKKPDQA